jgi:hypothetical protein
LLNPDFRDMLSALSEESAEFLLVGAYAPTAPGLCVSRRATGEMDVWIRRSDANAQRVWRGLQRFGLPLARLTIDDLKMPDMVLQIGVAPRRIDILTSINKKTVGRPQDLADVAWLERTEH